MYFCSVPVTSPLAFAFLNSDPTCVMTSASHGEPTGNVIRPIFQGFLTPLNEDQGVFLTLYGHGPYLAWISGESVLKMPSGSFTLYVTSWPHFCAAAAVTTVGRAEADAVTRAAATA